MRSLRSILFEGFVWITIACAAFVLTFKFDEPLMQYRYGATGWPRTLILAMAFFAIIQTLWSIFLSRKRGGPSASGPRVPAAASQESATGLLVRLKHVGTFALPLLYLLLLPRVGFYVSTPLLIAGYMALLGERRWIHLVGTTLLIYALSLIIFTKLLYVPLPVGNWPVFEDINAFFVSIIK